MASTLDALPLAASSTLALGVILIVLLWVLPIGVAADVTRGRGKGSAAGALLGLFLGWLGVGIALLFTERSSSPRRSASGRVRTYRECPHCKEQMRRDAEVCPHCRRESPSAV